MAEPNPQSTAPAPIRAEVVVNEPLGVLDYEIPSSLAGELTVGTPVRVPLGTRTTHGYISALPIDAPTEPRPLKPITARDTERPVIPETLIKLVLFAARYYHCPPGEVLSAALPARARVASTRYQLAPDGEKQLTEYDPKPADRALLELASRFPKGFGVMACERDLGWSRRRTTSRLKKHVDNGWLHRMRPARGAPRRAIAYRRVEGGADVKISPAARTLLERIPSEGTIRAAQLASEDRGAYRKLKRLEQAGLIERLEIEASIRPFAEPTAPETVPAPTEDQARNIAALNQAIEEATFRPFLLEGVTGSGKTEVYLRVIERTLSLGRTALVLVPEIALTPQLGRRFRARFGDDVATFHSGLTGAERRDEWERVATGRARIGLGARSALFLPLNDVGIIVVDEEHETSFKQEETPRYHARDLAVVRARLENAVVVLGSATPSIESRHNAGVEKYTSLRMPKRVSSRPLPEVESVDLRHGERVGEGIFSDALHQGLETTLARDEQAILFLNRRGFASNVSCSDCGYAFRCPSCDVSLTLHRRRDVLACHYCGYEERTVDECPSCHGLNLDTGGLGTERVEMELDRLLPGVSRVRLDRDTVRGRGDLEKALGRFASGEAKVLIGTQMVAKGHDFPGVTLVGVLNADAGLNFPDFRAAERTFQLLTQVAGRAGRGEKPGRVLVQSYDPSHYAITHASRHDYEAFVAEELRWREELAYPPYAYLALMRFESQSESRAFRVASSVADDLRRGASELSVLGPAASPIARIKSLWRFQVLVKSADRRLLHAALSAAPRYDDPQTRQILDVDPISML